MRILETNWRTLVHAHAPALVSLVRRIRTERYRSAGTRGRLRAQLDRIMAELSGAGSLPAAREIRKPKQLTRIPIVEINNTCNIDCVMCKTSLATRKKGKMSEEILGVALDRFSAMGISGVELHTIGDPLANPNLPRVLAELRKRQLSTALTTNGLLLQRHWRTLLEYGDVCKGIMFSIDGATKSTYERIRFGGKWETLLENIDIARTHLKGKIPLSTSMIVSKDNMGEIGRYITLFRDVVQEPSRDVKFGGLNSLSPENAYFESMNLFPGYTRKNIGCTYVSGESLYALIDGKVAVCCRDYDGSLVVGDLKTQSVPEIWAAPPLAKLRAAHESGNVSAFPQCDTCYVVDRNVHAGFSLFMQWVMHGRAAESAEFYQEAAERFIQILTAGPPVDVTQFRGLLARFDRH